MITQIKSSVYLLLLSISLWSCKKNNATVDHSTPLPTLPGTLRDTVNAQLIPIGNLSQARSEIAIASVNNTILLAGGMTSKDTPSSRVDIFDVTTNRRATAELSLARKDIASC